MILLRQQSNLQGLLDNFMWLVLWGLLKEFPHLTAHVNRVLTFKEGGKQETDLTLGLTLQGIHQTGLQFYNDSLYEVLGIEL